MIRPASLLRHLRPGAEGRVVVFDAVVGLVCVVILGVFILAGLHGLILSRRSTHDEARCLGWCEAHGYDRAFHTGDPSTPFAVADCYCAAPVGSDVALAPIETPEPEPAEDGIPQ